MTRNNSRTDQNVITFLSAIYKLASVHAFSSDEEFFSGFILVWIAESDDSQGRSSTRIVDDVLHKSLSKP